MHRSALLILSLLPAALVAQAPAPAAPAEVPLGQRLRTTRPEVDRLIEALQAKEAQALAEGLLPTTKPSWDNSGGNAQYKSYLAFQDLASAYYLAFRAATAAGQWEKALDHAKQAQALVQENDTQAQAAFPKISAAYQALADKGRATLKDNEAYINELKAKPNRDAGDEQQLGMVETELKAIAENEKWSKQFQAMAEAAKKDATRYDTYVKAMDERLKAEATQIAEYVAGKGDKAKWVDAIVSNPGYLTTNFPEKRGRVEYLNRLGVVTPGNPKVEQLIDVELGKAPAPGTKGKGPKKGK